MLAAWLLLGVLLGGAPAERASVERVAGCCPPSDLVCNMRLAPVRRPAPAAEPSALRRRLRDAGLLRLWRALWPA